MSENRVQKEPSTEEILGSIRRIISEDNAQAGSDNAADATPTASAGIYVPLDDMATDDMATDDMAPLEMASEALALGEMMPTDSASTEIAFEEIAPLEEMRDEETPAEAMSEVQALAETTPMDVTSTDAMDTAPGDITFGENAAEDGEIFELTDEIVEEEPILDTEPDTAYQPEEAFQPEEARREPRFGLSAVPSHDSGAEDDHDDRRELAIDVHAEELLDNEQQTPGDPGLTGAAAEALQGYNYSAQVLSSNQDMAGKEEHSMASTTDGDPEAPENSDDWDSSQPAADPGGVQDEIVSQAATTATATALSDLSRAVSEKTDKLKVGAETTVSDIVKEMLRPMLREWLDENLPLIVDRVVRREIQKLVDRTQDDE